jgi:hypothetical protein
VTVLAVPGGHSAHSEPRSSRSSACRWIRFTMPEDACGGAFNVCHLRFNLNRVLMPCLSGSTKLTLVPQP